MAQQAIGFGRPPDALPKGLEAADDEADVVDASLGFLDVTQCFARRFSAPPRALPMPSLLFRLPFSSLFFSSLRFPAQPLPRVLSTAVAPPDIDAVIGLEAAAEDGVEDERPPLRSRVSRADWRSVLVWNRGI